MAVGIEAPADEEEDEPLLEPLPEPLEPDAEEPDAAAEVAPATVDVPSEAREITELFCEWMLAKMLDWPALMAVALWMMEESAVAFGAAVTAPVPLAMLVATGTR